MKKFRKFYFEKFEFDWINYKAKFFYSFDKKQDFVEEIDFSSNFLMRKKLDKNIVYNILFSIHLSLGISYYKLFPTKNLIVESGFLSDIQIKFWKKFYINGLGEFLYTNNINPKGLFAFENASNTKFEKIDFDLSDKSLVPIGGGKDSIVTIELLKKSGTEFDLFVFGKSDILKENTAYIAGKEILLIKRKLSNNLFKLNDKGYYNGHVPITGIIAFNMLLVSYLYDYKYLVLSNELSANVGNTLWNGFEINHQYSKSLEFERDFKNYVEENISNDIKYFSLLRGIYEYKIAEIFSKKAKKYFTSFSSCNTNFTINKSSLKKQDLKDMFWCNNCPKCAFVYSILSGFLGKNDLIKIFGEDLYEKKDLEKFFRELLGISGIKPFECVGEVEEVFLGMYKSLKNYKDKLPYILKIFKKEVLIGLDEKYLENLEKKLLKIYDDDIIPKNFKSKINFN